MKSKSKLPRLSIYDIKRLTAETSPYYFDAKTLKFFHQKMSDFKVYRNDDVGKYYITAPIRDSKRKQIGLSEKWFNPVTNELENVEKQPS